MKIEIGQMSDIGMRRSENQDSMNFVSPEEKELLRKRGCLVMVADGMGGAAGGREASQMAVSIVPMNYFQSDGEDILECLKRAFEEANLEIFRRSQGDPSLKGMGTTATAIVFIDGKYFSAHIGDTRLYRLRKHELKQLSVDHSMVSQMVRDGLISAAEAKNHPQRNVLIRSMGIQESAKIDFHSDEVKAGDLYILCTDGLHGLVPDEDIAEIADSKPLDLACESLVTLAKDRGGYDNITVQIARIAKTSWF